MFSDCHGYCLGALLLLVTSMAAVGAQNGSPAHDYARWTTGSGLWTDVTHWSDSLPDAGRRVEVHGDGTVVVPAGAYIIGNLEIGLNSHDHVRVEANGGQIVLLQDSLRIGELSGGEGEFILKEGALQTFMDVYVGAANGAPERATKASMIVQGGSLLARSFYIGSGWGADSYLAIKGSKAGAVHILNCVYVQAHAAPDGWPGMAALSFTLDGHGVTPITIQSRHDGLRIIRDSKSQCRLEILLSAVPPREDVTLVSAHRPIQGAFDDLPEGSEITAEYEWQPYRWRLTYHGGKSGSDLVLVNESHYPEHAPVTRVRPMPEPPKPLWAEHPIYPPFRLDTNQLAFPGAEGFGAFTPGGRGGRTIYVTNLDDSGPGSLREAVNAPGPRTINFRVGGVIRLKSTLSIQEPFVTIDGQNAPGEGIMLRDHGVEVGISTLCFLGMKYSADGLGLRPHLLNDSARQGEDQRYGQKGRSRPANCAQRPMLLRNSHHFLAQRGNHNGVQQDFAEKSRGSNDDEQ
jgi:hypothetical protein